MNSEYEKQLMSLEPRKSTLKDKLWLVGAIIAAILFIVGFIAVIVGNFIPSDDVKMYGGISAAVGGILGLILAKIA
jgi:hypothetical protein